MDQLCLSKCGQAVSAEILHWSIPVTAALYLLAIAFVKRPSRAFLELPRQSKLSLGLTPLVICSVFATFVLDSIVLVRVSLNENGGSCQGAMAYSLSSVSFWSLLLVLSMNRSLSCAELGCIVIYLLAEGILLAVPREVNAPTKSLHATLEASKILRIVLLTSLSVAMLRSRLMPGRLVFTDQERAPLLWNCNARDYQRSKPGPCARDLLLKFDRCHQSFPKPIAEQRPASTSTLPQRDVTSLSVQGELLMPEQIGSITPSRFESLVSFRERHLTNPWKSVSIRASGGFEAQVSDQQLSEQSSTESYDRNLKRTIWKPDAPVFVPKSLRRTLACFSAQGESSNYAPAVHHSSNHPADFNHRAISLGSTRLLLNLNNAAIPTLNRTDSPVAKQMLQRNFSKPELRTPKPRRVARRELSRSDPG